MKELENPIIFSTDYNIKITPKTSSKNKRIAPFVLLFALILFISLDTHIFLICSHFLILINFLFKFFLFNKRHSISPHDIKIQEQNLPIYTILLPIYKEERHVMEALFQNIQNLNYPKDKLDVKVLLEEDDSLGIAYIPAGLPHYFEIIIVPNFLPKTKSKACNYGIYSAKGEFVVIYDSEDKPEKDQLLKALSVFGSHDKNVICVQCLLNFYNKDTNFLSKCFALEYLIWFNCFLPVASFLNMLIPLGGTSNHFRRADLMKIGVWDSYNVTEDAELGVRIAKNGFKTVILHSYTMEEAPTSLKNWIFQRIRWLKGYLQTFIVYMLDFKGNIIELFLLVGLSFFSFFLTPFILICSVFAEKSGTLYFLIFANVICSLYYIKIFRTMAIENEDFLGKGYKKIAYLMPFYFILHIIASIFAFVEILIKPFYWHKTKHGK